MKPFSSARLGLAPGSVASCLNASAAFTARTIQLCATRREDIERLGGSGIPHKVFGGQSSPP